MNKKINRKQCSARRKKAFEEIVSFWRKRKIPKKIDYKALVEKGRRF